MTRIVGEIKMGWMDIWITGNEMIQLQKKSNKNIQVNIDIFRSGVFYDQIT